MLRDLRRVAGDRVAALAGRLRAWGVRRLNMRAGNGLAESFYRSTAAREHSVLV